MASWLKPRWILKPSSETYQSGSLMRTNDKDWYHKRVNDLYNFSNCIFNRSNVSKLVSLHLGSQPTSVLCHMGDFGCGDGGWTPVMKINGNKVPY